MRTERTLLWIIRDHYWVAVEIRRTQSLGEWLRLVFLSVIGGVILGMVLRLLLIPFGV